MENIMTSQEAILYHSRFITKVYTWMALALVATGLTAMFVATTPSLIKIIFGSRITFYGLIIAEIALVFFLSFMINKMNSVTAFFIFFLYSVINGLTLSVIFLFYTGESIAVTFFVTAGTFGVMSAYGYFTKTDLTKIGNILLMALVGIVIASIVNIFLKSGPLYWIITIAGIIIFVGLTAYDTQKLKIMSQNGFDGAETEKKASIIGALQLYLDFINLFILLLRLLGRRK
jgi:FtsH-binding integral membrane protein